MPSTTDRDLADIGAAAHAQIDTLTNTELLDGATSADRAALNAAQDTAVNTLAHLAVDYLIDLAASLRRIADQLTVTRTELNYIGSILKGQK